MRFHVSACPFGGHSCKAKWPPQDSWGHLGGGGSLPLIPSTACIAHCWSAHGGNLAAASARLAHCGHGERRFPAVLGLCRCTSKTGIGLSIYPYHSGEYRPTIAIPGSIFVGTLFAYENGDALLFEPVPTLPEQVCIAVERQIPKLKRTPGRPPCRVMPRSRAAKAGQ